jgi:hypothetical protein
MKIVNVFGARVWDERQHRNQRNPAIQNQALPQQSLTHDNNKNSQMRMLLRPPLPV